VIRIAGLAGSGAERARLKCTGAVVVAEQIVRNCISRAAGDGRTTGVVVADGRVVEAVASKEIG
jgi:hypothetical protein